MPTINEDVMWMLDLIASVEGAPILAGGWGVDALVGFQTRTHRDLDLLLDEARVGATVTRLEQEGFVVVTDWLPVRIELSDTAYDRHIDLHPLGTDDRGGFWQHGLDGHRFKYPAGTFVDGRVNGRPVRCLSAAKQTELHTGYVHRPQDIHDLELLRTLSAKSPGHL